VSLGHPYEAKDTVTLFIGHNTLLFSGGGLVNYEWGCIWGTLRLQVQHIPCLTRPACS